MGLHNTWKNHVIWHLGGASDVVLVKFPEELEKSIAESRGFNILFLILRFNKTDEFGETMAYPCLNRSECFHNESDWDWSLLMRVPYVSSFVISDVT